jgi:hypothetical protein
VNDPHSFYAPDWTLREERFQELDYVMESARKHQTKVILALQNYWSAYGGIGAITARFGVHKLEYFTDARCKQSFKDYVAFLANRVNTVNGRRYADDPALFAWELMNEPRMDINDDETLDKHLYDPTGAKLGAWMDEMSTFIKGVDPKHMVAPGSEGHGFKGWGGSTDGYGTDPVAVMSQPNIDVYTFHPYMNEDWDRLTIGEAKALVRGFVRAGIAHGKPVVMEEYGFNKSLPVLDLLGTPVAPTSPRYGAVRGAWYRLVTATLRRERGGGSNVWNLEADAQDASYGVSFFSPASAADADRSVAAALADEATTMKAVGVTKANVWDLRQRDTDFAGFIDEVAYRRLMRLDFYGHFFNPDAATTEGEFVGILTNMGVDTASYSPSAGAPLTMDRAAQVLYSTLHLSTYGGMDEALKRVDVQPENRDGQYIASAVMQNTTTAALVIRVTDFLLYRDL